MIYALLSRNFVVEITHFFRKILGLGSRICKLFRFLDVWMTGANWSSPWDDSDDSSNVSTFAGLSWDFRSKRESRTTRSRVSQRRQIISSFPSSFWKTPRLTTHPFKHWITIKNHSIQYWIQKLNLIIHSKNLFIQKLNLIIHSKKYSFKLDKKNQLEKTVKNRQKGPFLTSKGAFFFHFSYE